MAEPDKKCSFCNGDRSIHVAVEMTNIETGHNFRGHTFVPCVRCSMLEALEALEAHNAKPVEVTMSLDRCVHAAVSGRTLTGGEGPDEAATLETCRDCKKSRWTYCDGTKGSWQ